MNKFLKQNTAFDIPYTVNLQHPLTQQDSYFYSSEQYHLTLSWNYKSQHYSCDPDKQIQCSKQSKAFPIITPELIKKIISALEKKYCVITLPEISITLSKKESECLLYIISGLTAKEIAEQLCRSRRTIEHYIDTLREKLFCKKKSQLRTTALRGGFLDNFSY